MAWSSGDAAGVRERSLKNWGTSDSTGSFFIVGGSSRRIPSSIWLSRGRSLSELSSFVGLHPVAKAIVAPMAEIALATAAAVILWPRP